MALQQMGGLWDCHGCRTGGELKGFIGIEFERSQTNFIVWDKEMDRTKVA